MDRRDETQQQPLPKQDFPFLVGDVEVFQPRIDLRIDVVEGWLEPARMS